MSFGKVIFNPFSDEALALLKKRVKAGVTFTLVNADDHTGIGTLESISYLGFKVRWEKTGRCSVVQFVREVTE